MMKTIYNKLINFLSNIPKDCWMHYTISLLIVCILARILCLCNLDKNASLFTALGISLFIGLCKEIIDAKKSGNIKALSTKGIISDLLSDLLGSLTGVVILL